jgi:hypothetical protein
MSQTGEVPNLFELIGEGVSINYSSSGLDGQAQFSIQRHSVSKNMTGNEISVQRLDPDLGSLITVSLEGSPDLDTVTFSVLLPDVNLHGHMGIFETLALETIHRTSFGGPGLVQGALQIYRAIPLKGTARAVEF